jgi:hypothetical protein
MTERRRQIAIIGAGAACAACCSAPVAGFVAAIGAGTIAAGLLFGAAGLVVATAIAFVLYRRRQSRSQRGRRDTVSDAHDPRLDSPPAPHSPSRSGGLGTRR